MPFDPAWNFETLVRHLNSGYLPGGMLTGVARNALIRAWGICVGRQRATSELREAITKYGSGTALRRAIHMSGGVLSEIESSFDEAPEREVLRGDATSLRTGFGTLNPEGRDAFLGVAAELLRDQVGLQRLGASSRLASLPSILSPALRVMDVRNAIDELETHLTGGVANEQTYQVWCDHHSWAFGNAYVLTDGLRRIDEASIADLLMPTLIGYRDIIELKRPTMPVLNWDHSHRSYYLSAEVSKAIGQVHQYMDKLHDRAQRAVTERPDVLAYHPHATVVIGRSADWNDAKRRALHGLNERLHGVSVVTYDHLLARARRVLSSMTEPSNGEAPARR